MSPPFPRPSTPAGFDPSRAAERAADPRGWRYDDARLQAVYDVIEQRRDVRRFRTTPVPPDIVEGLLERDIGIEKYFSYVIIKSPFVKSHYPLETLFSQNHN